MVNQLSGVESVGSAAIGGHRSGGRCVGNERSGRCVQRRQTLCGTPEAPGIRVVAAGIEDHQVHPIARGFHLGQHPANVHGFILYVFFSADLSLHGDHVVVPLHLHPVSGVVEQPQPTVLQLFAKAVDCALHVTLRCVFEQVHIKAQAS